MNLDWLKEINIAHRGLHDKLNPENSLGAFVNAIEKGYSIELDVHLTNSGEVIVFHDNNLLRMCNQEIKTVDIDTKNLQKYRLAETDFSIPTLKEVLELVSGKVGIVIELKVPFKAKAICEAVWKVLKDYNGNYCVKSFNYLVPKWFKNNQPQVIRGQLACFFKKPHGIIKFMHKTLRFLKVTDPHFISYCVDNLPNKHIEKARKYNKDIIVLAWTVRDKNQLNNARIYADNIVFETIDPTSQTKKNTAKITRIK